MEVVTWGKNLKERASEELQIMQQILQAAPFVL